MRLGQDVLSDLRSALAMEWLITNGLGGSASGTVIGAQSRRTHALLTSADSHGRLTTLLLKFNERLHAQGAWHHVSSNIHSGPVVRPTGHEYLEEFTLDPWPIWRIRVGDVRIEKSVFFVEAHNSVAVTYKHLEGPAARLAVSPLVVGRQPGALNRENGETASASQSVPGRIRVDVAPDVPRLTLWHNGSFMPARVWVRDLVYPGDVSDDDACEDALIPCHMEAMLEPGGDLHVVASSEEDLFKALAREDRLGTPPPRTLRECVNVLARDRHREWAKWRATSIRSADFTARQATVAHGDPGAANVRRLEPLIGRDDPWAPVLADSLYACLARRGHRTTLLSSLPSAREAGADTLRAVPALVAIRAFDLSRAVMAGYVEYLNEGVAPESFDPADGTPAYGDPTPSLWLINAAELHVRRSEDVDFLKSTLYPALEGVLQFYRSGTRHGIRTTEDGLLSCGEGDAASIRADVNALWYHALVAMAQMAKLVGRRENGAFYLAWARELQKQFVERLWDDDRGCLFDALTDSGPVADVSAGQLLAVSLSPALLPPDHAARLLQTVERDLVTPVGVRTKPGAPAPLGWLGPYVTAYLRVHGRSDEAQTRVREWLNGVRTSCMRVSLGHAPYALAPDAPADRPRLQGDPVSLISAAELLRAWVEEIDHSRTATVVPAT